MTNEIEPKTYEFAYHLIPEIEEAEAKAQAQEIFDLINKNHGSILSSRGPERIRLSYPIRHKRFSYFGSFDFTAPPEAIGKINAQAKLQNNILRFLLIKKPSSKDGLRVLGDQRIERPRQKAKEPSISTAKTKPSVEETKKTEEEVKAEEIEKEIEEVIKGL